MSEVSREELERARALLMERNPVTADDHARVVAEAAARARQDEREACAETARIAMDRSCVVHNGNTPSAAGTASLILRSIRARGDR